MADIAQGSMPAPARLPKVETPFQRFVSEFMEDKVAVGALLALALIVILALIAPWITPQNPYDLAQVTIMDARRPPGGQSMDGYTFLIGSDGVGRDLYSSILYGLRISLAVGLLSGLLAVCVGASVGLIAAYVGGRTDAIIMRIVDLQLSLPSILVALILVAAIGKGIDKIILALVIVQWAYYARTVRASALVERKKEYVEAATCLGLSHGRILFRHNLPNCLAPLIVVATEQTAPAIAL